VVHVPGQEGHRVRGGAALAVRHRQRHLGDLAEAVLEGAPVLEVDRLSHPLAEPRAPVAPGALDERLVPRLEVVQAGREQVREGRPHEQVPEAASHLLVEPGELVGVEHGAALRLEHPRRA